MTEHLGTLPYKDVTYNELLCDNSNDFGYASREVLDKTGHLPITIKVFAVG